MGGDEGEQEERCATATVPCSAAFRERARLSAFDPSTSELPGSHNRSQSVSSLTRYHENIPLAGTSQQRTARDALCLLFFPCLSHSRVYSSSFPRFKMLHGPQKEPKKGRSIRMSAEKRHGRSLTQRRA